MTRPPGYPPPRAPMQVVPHQIERQTFRRRRLIDAACALPLVGWVLWWLPLMFHHSETPVPASLALIYIFGVWLGLALIAARLVRLLEAARAVDPPAGEASR
ncbi:hypothetical protein [Maliponia aquimaris]|uniref:Uncharacterized protein n=1 Tax=Maliponia aquimaris TaxID=1673631 RepID=A0A238L4E1_9RHOB|nr:hypothetical protein [Maliponia aquimaris]SMX49953.1 hypothetical protein MAA8898_04532 [Maliponia aquimaris]